MPTELTVQQGGGISQLGRGPGRTRESSLPRCPLREAPCGAGSTSAVAPGSPPVRAVQELRGGLRSGPAAVLVHSSPSPRCHVGARRPFHGAATCTILPKPVQSVSRESQRAHSLLRPLCVSVHACVCVVTVAGPGAAFTSGCAEASPPHGSILKLES